MGKRDRTRIADVAQEAGLTELEAVKRLRQNGVIVREGYRINRRDLQKIWSILSSGDDAIRTTQETGAKDRATTSARERSRFEIEAIANDTPEPQPAEERMRVIDVIEDWLYANPEPKHFTVAGRTYNDFIRSCYRYLLVHALKQGAPSTNIMVGTRDRQQIIIFLNRAKTIWVNRRNKEQAEEEARRQAEEHRLAEKRHMAEALRQSEIQRQRKLLQADEQRLAKKRREDEVRRQLEARRHVDAKRQRESHCKADVEKSEGEKKRIEQVLAKHRRSVENEGRRLSAGQCTSVDYYAFVLRDRVERAAELLFGSANQPSYEIIRKNAGLLEKLKELSFGDNRHPRSYKERYVNAYYTLRYELGYAFEYSQIYGLLLSIMHQENEDSPIDVLSIGSGQGLDYWGLRYALSKQGMNRPSFGWRGVDLETWPDHILDDDIAHYTDGTDALELLGRMDELDVKVLMFPKVISEMPYEVISSIASWLEHVAFTRDVHYLCFAHTDRRSLNSADSKHRGAGDYFHGITESSLDAVKSAALINAARNGAARQSYDSELGWHDSNVMSVSHYNVVWPDAQTGSERRHQYSYLEYSGAEGGNWPVWRDDPTFEMDKPLRTFIKNVGSKCCGHFIAACDERYSSEGSDCEVRLVSCDNSYFCPLFKYPRFKTGSIAYQIVRLVKKTRYDEDIPF